MFIRVVKKQRSKDSKVFYQYTLAQTSRVEGKVKQTNILYLGSDPLMQDSHNRMIVLSILKSRIFGQAELFPLEASAELKSLALQYYEAYEIKYGIGRENPTSIPPRAHQAEYHKVDIKGLDIEDAKEFGAEHLCKQILDKLELGTFLANIGLNADESKKALISIAAKAIYASSEYKTAQILEMNSELGACYGYKGQITHKDLYGISDILYTHKTQIDNYLYNRVTDLFSLKDNLVIFDISNTYFETSGKSGTKAKFGRSKEKRNDCPIVVFTGVINQEGFIHHSRIYEGNKPDVATLEDMINDLEKHSCGHAKQTIVIDAGIADDLNLELLDSKGYKYVCVSRKRIKDYKLDDSSSNTVRFTTKGDQKVELKIFHPEQYNDTWMYVESDGKRLKEQSINHKLRQRFEEELLNIKNSLSKKGGTKQINKVWERIGRTKQKHNRISSRYKIEVFENDNIAFDIRWEFTSNKIKDDKSNGVYFIRTNHSIVVESIIWDIYNTIREVESTFRSLKSDLNIRPVYHQRDDRIEAHIYLTILAYQLVNTIRYMLKSTGIHHDWKNILRIMSTHKIQTLKIPTDKKTIFLRKPTNPIVEVQQIYTATNCSDYLKPLKKYVVYH